MLPKIDNFTLVPKPVADAESVNPTVLVDSNADEKAEFVRTSGVNFVLNDISANGGDAGATTTNTVDDSTFYVYDLSNNGDFNNTGDGSYNVIATFKIYAKYNDDNSALTTTKFLVDNCKMTPVIIYKQEQIS